MKVSRRTLLLLAAGGVAGGLAVASMREVGPGEEGDEGWEVEPSVVQVLYDVETVVVDFGIKIGVFPPRSPSDGVCGAG